MKDNGKTVKNQEMENRNGITVKNTQDNSDKTE